MSPSGVNTGKYYTPLRHIANRQMKIKKTTRTTEITVEKSESFVVRRAPYSVPAWCASCGKRVRLVKPEEAAVAAGLNVREVYRRIETGNVHFVEAWDGTLVVCIRSLQHNVS